jgi:hypothetical protein
MSKVSDTSAAASGLMAPAIGVACAGVHRRIVGADAHRADRHVGTVRTLVGIDQEEELERRDVLRAVPIVEVAAAGRYADAIEPTVQILGTGLRGVGDAVGAFGGRAECPGCAGIAVTCVRLRRRWFEGATGLDVIDRGV